LNRGESAGDISRADTRRAIARFDADYSSGRIILTPLHLEIAHAAAELIRRLSQPMRVCVKPACSPDSASSPDPRAKPYTLEKTFGVLDQTALEAILRTPSFIGYHIQITNR
jgi:hypothetical protein